MQQHAFMRYLVLITLAILANLTPSFTSLNQPDQRQHYHNQLLSHEAHNPSAWDYKGESFAPEYALVNDLELRGNRLDLGELVLVNSNHFKSFYFAYSTSGPSPPKSLQI